MLLISDTKCLLGRARPMSTQVSRVPLPENVTGLPAVIVPAETADVGAGAALVTMALTDTRGAEPAVLTAATEKVKVPLGISTNVALRAVGAADIAFPD